MLAGTSDLSIAGNGGNKFSSARGSDADLALFFSNPPSDALQGHSLKFRKTTVAAKQLVQTRIGGAIKEETAAVLAAMGLTISDAVRLLLTKVAHDKALPFELLIPNAATIEAMKEARAGKLPRFANVDALIADLNAPD